MHGRIVEYSHATGKGAIINNHKKIFDFKIINWHDKTRIPEIDLLVEFRLDDENNSVIDIRSSKYQEFNSDSIIKESDFWKTVSDDELEKLEQGAFEELIAETCKETDYANLSEIEPSISVESFMDYHFEIENRIINYALQLPTNGYELLDYRVFNRFLMRTLDSLVYTEKRVTKDTFSAYLQIYTKLQYYITPFYKAQQDTQKVYEEAFLSQQLYFIAAKRKLTNIKEDLMRIDRRIQGNRSSIRGLELRLGGGQNSGDKEARERLIALKTQIQDLQNEQTMLLKTKEHIEEMLKNFVARYEGEFFSVFEATREKIFENIKLSLNTTITSMDNKMWEVGMASEPVKNYYFKLDVCYSFCIMAFILQYLRTLNQNKLSDNDRLLSLYVQRYRERNTKKILIVSSNPRLKNQLRMKLLSLYKDFLITQIGKKMEYEITIANQGFDFIVIDNELEDSNPIEMAIFAKSKKQNKNARVVIYQIAR